MYQHSWGPIDFERWLAAAVCASSSAASTENLTTSIERLRVCWERLRDDIDQLFIPSGPEGTHAHHHYHSPSDPVVRRSLLAACFVDYESALLFLDIALELSSRAVSSAASLSYFGRDNFWITLVQAAENGVPGLPTDACDHILYLQRTVLFARNKAIVHPGDHHANASFDNTGNLVFWRINPNPDESLHPQLDALLHRVHTEIRTDALVPTDIPASVALTLIGSRSDKLDATDRSLFDQLRKKLTYQMPEPAEIAFAVNGLIEDFIAALPVTNFSRLALTPANRPATVQPDVAAPVEPADPRQVAQLLEAGTAQGNAGQHEEARQTFADALALDPESAHAHYGLGKVLQGLKRYDEALQHYYAAQAIGVPFSLREDLLAAHFNLAAEAFNAGRSDEAVAHYRRAHELDMSDIEINRHLAVALGRSGQHEAALVEIARLMDKNSGVAEVRLDAGIVLLAAGHLDRAIEQFEKALQLRPGWQTATDKRSAAIVQRSSPTGKVTRRDG